MLTKQELLNLLRTDVVPALGCTEPVCVALCAAYAGKAILKNPEKQLKLLEDLTPELLQKASVLVSEGKTQVSMDPQIQGLYVKCIIMRF